MSAVFNKFNDVFQKKIRTGKVFEVNGTGFVIKPDTGSNSYTVLFENSWCFEIPYTKEMAEELCKNETPISFIFKDANSKEITSIREIEHIEAECGFVSSIDTEKHYALVKTEKYKDVFLSCTDVLFQDVAKLSTEHVVLSAMSPVKIRFVKMPENACEQTDKNPTNTKQLPYNIKYWAFEVEPIDDKILFGSLDDPFTNLFVCCKTENTEEGEKWWGKSRTLGTTHLLVNHEWQNPGVWFKIYPINYKFQPNEFSTYYKIRTGKIFDCDVAISGTNEEVKHWENVYFVLIKLTKTKSQEDKDEYIVWNDYFGEIPVKREDISVNWQPFDVLKGNVGWELSNEQEINFKIVGTLGLITGNEADLNRCRFAQQLATLEITFNATKNEIAFGDPGLIDRLKNNIKEKYRNSKPPSKPSEIEKGTYRLTFYFSRNARRIREYRILSITKAVPGTTNKLTYNGKHPHWLTTGRYIIPRLTKTSALSRLWQVEPREGSNEKFGVFYSTRESEKLNPKHIDFYWIECIGQMNYVRTKTVVRSDDAKIGQLGIMNGTDATTIREYEINQGLLGNNTNSHATFDVVRRGENQNPTITVFGMITRKCPDGGWFAWAFPIDRVWIIDGKYKQFDIVEIQAEYDEPRGWISESKSCIVQLQTAEFLIHLERCNNLLFKEYCAEKQNSIIPDDVLETPKI